MPSKLKPVHPGEILREDFIAPLGLNPHKLSLALRVSAPTISEITREKRSISPDVALRLARYFDTTPEFWLNLQSRYDLELVRDEEEERVMREVEPLRPAATH